MMQKTGRGKSPMLGSPKCSVCGDLAVHVLKRGAIVLCDKHYQQRFGRWSGSSEGQAYNFAYNEGHSDSRKKEGYNPIKSKQDLVPFHRILKQKGAESTTSDRPVWGAKMMNNIGWGQYIGGGHYLLVDPSHVMMLYSDGAESAIGLKKPNGQPAPRIPAIDFDGPTATKTVREMKAALKEADTLINFKNATYSTDNLKQAIMKLPINTEVTLQNGITPNMPLKMTFDFKGKTYHYLLAPRVSDDWDEKMNTSGVTLDAESYSAESAGENDTEVGNTIYRQLGGNRFRMMTGAKEMVWDGDNNSLQMKIGRNSLGANYLIITLNANDLYDMRFESRRWNRKTYDLNIKVKGEYNDLYADQLQEVFTEATGLYTRMAESFSAEPRASDLGEDDDLLPVGTKVRSYDFWPNDSSYIEGVIEKIAPSPRCSPDCMHYHIRTTKTVRQGEETKEDAIGEIFMTHPYEDFGWTLKRAKHIQVMDAESFNASTHYTYYYTLSEHGDGDNYDTLEDAQEAVANSDVPMEIYERRVDRLSSNQQKDIKLSAESFFAEYVATMCDSCEAIYPQKMEGHECECKGTIRNLYEYADGSADFDAESFSANPQGRPRCSKCEYRYGMKTCGACGDIQCERCFGSSGWCKSCPPKCAWCNTPAHSCSNCSEPNYLCVDCCGAESFSADNIITCEECGTTKGVKTYNSGYVGIMWTHCDKCRYGVVHDRKEREKESSYNYLMDLREEMNEEDYDAESHDFSQKSAESFSAKEYNDIGGQKIRVWDINEYDFEMMPAIFKSWRANTAYCINDGNENTLCGTGDRYSAWGHGSAGKMKITCRKCMSKWNKLTDEEIKKIEEAWGRNGFEAESFNAEPSPNANWKELLTDYREGGEDGDGYYEGAFFVDMEDTQKEFFVKFYFDVAGSRKACDEAKEKLGIECDGWTDKNFNYDPKNPQGYVSWLGYENGKEVSIYDAPYTRMKIAKSDSNNYEDMIAYEKRNKEGKRLQGLTTVFNLLQFIKHNKDIYRYNYNRPMKDFLPAGQYRAQKGKEASPLYYGRKRKEIKEGDVLKYAGTTRLHYDTNVAFDVPIYDYDGVEIKYYDRNGRQIKRGGRGRPRSAYFENALFSSQKRGSHDLPLTSIPSDWLWIGRVLGLTKEAFYNDSFRKRFNEWISKPENEKMVEDEYNKSFGAESFEAMSLNEEHICFICGATKEDIEGFDDMMSTKGGDACKTCAEEYGYKWPDDMIYLDGESLSAEWDWQGLDWKYVGGGNKLVYCEGCEDYCIPTWSHSAYKCQKCSQLYGQECMDRRRKDGLWCKICESAQFLTRWPEETFHAESEDDSVKIEISNPFSTGFFAAIGVTVGLITTAVAGALIVAGAVDDE